MGARTDLKDRPRLTNSHSGIPYSAMKSGQWRIVMAGQQVQVQRTMTLTVGFPETTTITVCRHPSPPQRTLQAWQGREAQRRQGKGNPQHPIGRSAHG